MNLIRPALLVVLAILAAPPAMAVQPDEMLKDPGLEARARSLSAELRCLVCQNQSIDDSDAPLARDLRILIRERLIDGDSDEEALDFIVARYGEFVLLKPRLTFRTLLLWLGPFAILLLGSLFLWRRRSGDPQAELPLNEAEMAELRRRLPPEG